MAEVENQIVNNNNNNNNELEKINELSEDEFKKKILYWFKERGLLSDMRTYLRYQMITYLRETEIGHKLDETVHLKNNYNSKLRALHFLIAEFLLNMQHYYTLSILISEVPFLNIFPEISSLQNITELAQSKTVFRFHKNDIADLLNALGIPKNTCEMKQIENLYYKNENCSLIMIIIHLLVRKMIVFFTDQSSSNEQLDDKDGDNTVVNRWNQAIYHILKKSINKGSNIYAVRDRFVRFFSMEFERLRNDLEIKCDESIAKAKEITGADIKNKEIEWRQQQLNMEKQFNEQIVEYKNLIIEREHTIKKLCLQVKDVQIEINKITELRQKLKKESDSKKHYKISAQILKKECVKLVNEMKSNHQIITEKDDTINDLKNQIVQINNVHNGVVKEYVQEISDLKQQQLNLNEQLQHEQDVHNQTQQKLCDKITENESLAKELNELKLNNEFLMQQLHDMNIKTNKLKEQFDCSSKAPIKKSYSDTTATPTQTNHCCRSISSDSNSPINDILHETRQRLANLETASKLVEQNYRKYRQNSRSPVRFSEILHLFVDHAQTEPIAETQFNDSNQLEMNLKSSRLHKLISEPTIRMQNKSGSQLLQSNSLVIEPILPKSSNRSEIDFTGRQISSNDVSEILSELKVQNITEKTIVEQNIPAIESSSKQNNTSDTNQTETNPNKISPYFHQVQNQLISSLNNFECSVTEMSNDLKQIVDESTNLTETIETTVSNTILRQQSNLRLKAVEFVEAADESSEIIALHTNESVDDLIFVDALQEFTNDDEIQCKSVNDVDDDDDDDVKTVASMTVCESTTSVPKSCQTIESGLLNPSVTQSENCVQTDLIVEITTTTSSNGFEEQKDDNVEEISILNDNDNTKENVTDADSIDQLNLTDAVSEYIIEPVDAPQLQTTQAVTLSSINVNINNIIRDAVEKLKSVSSDSELSQKSKSSTKPISSPKLNQSTEQMLKSFQQSIEVLQQQRFSPSSSRSSSRGSKSPVSTCLDDNQKDDDFWM